MNWRKLNHLCPEPQCQTREGIIIEWTDTRPQPTEAEIDAVDLVDVEAAEAQKKEDDFAFPDVMKTIAKAFHYQQNQIRELQGEPPITFRQVTKALRTL